MRTFFEYLRGVGDYDLVQGSRQQLLESRFKRIPDSFLDFSLNRDIPNWPAPEGWERVSLPDNSGEPGRQTSSPTGFRIKEAWAFDWVKPGQSNLVASPVCGTAAVAEFSVTYGSSIEIELEFPDLEGYRFSASYSQIEQTSTNMIMNSGEVQAPLRNFQYMVIPLIEVVYFKKIENYIGSQSGSLYNFIRYGITSFSYGYERMLYSGVLNYAVARRPCVPRDEDGMSDLEEDQ